MNNAKLNNALFILLLVFGVVFQFMRVFNFRSGVASPSSVRSCVLVALSCLFVWWCVLECGCLCWLVLLTCVWFGFGMIGTWRCRWIPSLCVCVCVCVFDVYTFVCRL